MKKTMMAGVLALGLSVHGWAMAADKPSCDDLTEMANALDEVANAMEAQGSIKEGSADDTALKELVDALKVVATVEGNQNLATSVNRMESTWHAMDWSGFVTNLDNTTSIFDAILTLDCPQ